MTTWFLAQTKGSRERYAAKNVQRQGHRFYLPVYWCERTKQRRALFPSYLFIESRDGTWHWIENTFGCSRVVKVGEAPYKVPPSLIRQMQATENQNGVIALPEKPQAKRYEKGELVRIHNEAHPFWGHVGMFSHYSAKRRVSIFLSLLGKQVPVEIDEVFTEAA